MGLVEEMALEEEGELEGLALLVAEKGLPAIEVLICTSPDEACLEQNALPVFTINNVLTGSIIIK